jgi:hypothetical protein
MTNREAPMKAGAMAEEGVPAGKEPPLKAGEP